jgi:hypothetical protein
MVHPVTGRTISSYKKLMHDPATTEVWQTAFGKDFGGMAQGCNKTGQKGTNAMFVMSHNEIAHALAAKKKFTYANPVVDYRPQKEDPHRIHIMAGGNLINYEGNASVQTADLYTAKLHWNSVVSTKDARYMCLDIKKNSHRGPRILRVHEDPPRTVPVVDGCAIQSQQISIGQVGVY